MAETEKGFFSPGGAGLFAFFGNEPTSYESLKHRRKIAEALAAQKRGFPKNVGEGLTYLGESIGEAGLNYRLRQAELADSQRVAGASDSLRSPGAGTVSPPPAAATTTVAPGPRAAVSPAVATTVAAAEGGDTETPTVVAYAPEAPRDPPVDVVLPEVSVDTAAPQPYFGGDPMNAPMARGVPSSMLSGQNVYKPPLSGGAVTAQPAGHLVAQGRQAVGVADQGNMEAGLRRLGAQRLAETEGNALFDPNASTASVPTLQGTQVASAPPELTADVPLPRARPEAPAAAVTVADGGYNALDQAAVNRANPMVRGVNPRLIDAVNAGALALPEGHTVRISSGHRPGDSGFHGRGSAIDVKIVRPDGTEIPSRGEDKTGLYTQLARGAYTHALKNDQHIAWGGAFDTAKRGGTGNRDLMHFDTGPERGNLDPSLRLSRLGPLPADFDPNAPGGRGVTQVANTPREAVANSMAIMAAGQQPPEADQLVRSRDVLGGGGMGSPQPRTASLGRAGIQSDAVPLGMNPTGSNVDAGVAEAVQQRNSIADKILQNQNKIPVPEEPVTGPTQAGAASSPTTTSSSLAAGSSTTASPSPSPQLAQAQAGGIRATDALPPGWFTSPTTRQPPIAPPPSGVLGPSGASPQVAPSVGAAQPAPAQVPESMRPSYPDKPPPEFNRPRPVPPDAPTRALPGPEETAARNLLRSTDHPEIQRRAAAVAGEWQKIRDDNYARDVEAYKAKMTHHSALDSAWIKDQVEARDRYYKELKGRNEVIKGANEIVTQPELLQAELSKTQGEAREVALKNEEAERVGALAKQMGGMPKQAVEAIVDDHIKTRKPAIETIAKAQPAIRQARLALASGAITGFGADARINWARLMSAMGQKDQGSDAANSQLFKALMQPVVNAQRVAAVGNTNISNVDMVISERAAGADFTLEPKTLSQMLNILEENAVESLKDYDAKAKVLFGTDKNAGAQAAFGAPRYDTELQKLPAPPNGQPVHVWSSKDASRYPSGTPIILPDGRVGKVK
jgi:hypothetical protein